MYFYFASESGGSIHPVCKTREDMDTFILERYRNASYPLRSYLTRSIGVPPNIWYYHLSFQAQDGITAGIDLPTREGDIFHSMTDTEFLDWIWSLVQKLEEVYHKT